MPEGVPQTRCAWPESYISCSAAVVVVVVVACEKGQGETARDGASCKGWVIAMKRVASFNQCQ